MDIVKNFCKRHHIPIPREIGNFSVFKNNLSNKYDQVTSELLTDELIMQCFPASYDNNYTTYEEYNEKNSLYTVLKQNSNNPVIKKIINDFRPCYPKCNKYLFIWMDGQSGIHMGNHFNQEEEKKYCNKYSFEEFLGFHITNLFVSDINISVVAQEILMTFLDDFFYYNVTRPDRLRYALNYILPEYSTIELENCTENRLNVYSINVNSLDSQKIDNLTMNDLNGIKIENKGGLLSFEEQLKIVYNVYIKMESKLKKERVEFLKTTHLPDDIVDNIISKFL